MKQTRLNFAAIDIGSNAVRLLIKGIDPGEGIRDMTKSLFVRVPLRLGEDTFGQGEISEQKEKQLRQTIKSFKLLMKVFRVKAYRACGTSAMRDASNGKRIAEDICHKIGVNLEVIDGQEEARIVYDSHIADLLDSGADYIYVDVGGGSTEVSLISRGELISSHSYNIGTVRSLAGRVNPSEWKALHRRIDRLREAYPELGIIGSGGNINKLSRLDRSTEPGVLTVARLGELYEQLKPLSIEQRIERFKLNPDRADVIVPAAEVFLCVAGWLGAEQIRVPNIGIIDGITHVLCARYLDTKKRSKR